MKKVIISLVVVAIVAAGAYFLLNKQGAQPAQKSGSSQQTSKSTFDPKNPNFVLGSVTKATAAEIDFKSGANNYQAAITASTTLVKQVKTGSGIQVVAATLADFKAGSSIVVYFSSAPHNGVYQADKIQIISQ